MAVTQLQLRRGTTGQCTGMTPAQGEPIFDITLSQLRVGDGVTAGGFALPRFDASGNIVYGSAAATFAALTVASITCAGNGSIAGTLASGNHTITGTLGVSGISTLASLGVTNNAAVGGTLSVVGHVTVEGVTSTGATGTGKVVFDTAPTMSNPVVGTQATGDSSTKAASTAFVQGAVAPFDGINKIINGNFLIDQRASGASVTPATSGYSSCDRWANVMSQASKYSVQQNAGALSLANLPVGFCSYFGATSTSAYTPLTADAFQIQQVIEGVNCADLMWGSASAQSVTLSFWVRSSLTGSFSGSLRNSGSTRSYPFSYSIAVANTWTKISITIPGDQSGTWLRDTGVGITLAFNLGAGSTNNGTAGAWTSGNFIGVTSSVNLVATNGATLYFTGVQLETGSIATGFDNRQYGQEFALCQRYYQYWSGTSARITFGMADNTTTSEQLLFLPVNMRAVPSISSGSMNLFDGNNTPISISALVVSTLAGNSLFMVATAAGLTQYRPYMMLFNGAGFFSLSAEL